MATSSTEFFETFFEEKDIPFAIFEVRDSTGTLHLIESGAVIDTIKQTVGDEAAKLENILRRLDFANAPILPFLRHLAPALAENYAAH